MEIEIKILDLIQGIRTPEIDKVMCIITSLGNAGAIWIILAFMLLIIPKTRKSGILLAVALLIDVVVCNGILKNLFGRIRPCDVNTSVQLLIARPDDFSFPSGHTAASFAATAALFLGGEKKIWKPALLLSGFIAFSRMYLYIHYPTDIIGGILVGIGSALVAYRAVDKMKQWKRIKEVKRISPIDM